MRRFLFSLCLVLFLFAPLTVYATDMERIKGVAVVEVESLNVRSGPSKDSDKLGTLDEGVSVDVKGVVDRDWYVIDFEGKDGYINGNYITFTPQDEIEGGIGLVAKKYMVMALVVGILLISGLMIYTFINIKNDKEEIPITNHDDTNMHIGEVTYDTYRIDIDPRYFEQTTMIPQPDSIYDEVPYKKELSEEEMGGEQVTSEADIQTLDSKLEQASAQIAALQKEVEELKKQQPDKV